MHYKLTNQQKKDLAKVIAEYEFKRITRRQEEATTKIQALVRGWLIRKKIKIMEENQNNNSYQKTKDELEALFYAD